MAGSFDVEIAVIGAGVVGLAIARQLSGAGYGVAVLESDARAGLQTSARNSGVIHAGIYYPKGSLKARMCVEGKALLYDYCAARSIAHKRCGKLIVACSDAEEARLAKVAQAARANGLVNLEPLGKQQAIALEPGLHCQAALLSPSTGILDVPALLQALEADAQRTGTAFAYRNKVTALAKQGAGIRLVLCGNEGSQVTAKWVINAAGHGAPALASLLGPAPNAAFAKGNYFALRGKAPFSHLVYPLPEKAGLGVHFTMDLAGNARFGPDVEWVDAADYAVDPARAERFYEAIRRYWPQLPDGALEPDYAGIRPKLTGTDGDFQIARNGALINLMGIESPGITASLALARHIQQMIEQT